eukprot:TRINITY_DN12258_c0_g1_i1.p1 TRINITY_DN12258_c0_g1~~TRINITY_DN12258_c0_g1_i1.p1  ORF type:complete len:328 (+),score=79.59 TRINITY_DN12258_c0_g1_i1:340-1323(+)
MCTISVQRRLESSLIIPPFSETRLMPGEMRGHRLGGGDDSESVVSSMAFCFAACFILIVLLLFSFTVVPVGSLGVVSVLGSVQNEPLQNGWHLVTPFISTVHYMNTRLKVLHFADNVPTQEGVNVHLEASCINRLDPAKAVEMYKNVGLDFDNKVLLPEFQSVIRSVTSAHSSQALYSAEARTTMTRDLKSGIDKLVKERGIIVEMALINKLMLPHAIEYAIEKKMAIEQQAEQMRYVLEKEKLLAEQKVILATGIAQFQSIVSKGVNEKLLRWKGIETTKALAESCNPKIVIIGKQGNTPIILNQDGTPMKAQVVDPLSKNVGEGL